MDFSYCRSLLPRRVEMGAVVKIDVIEILEEEETCNMRNPYIYGVISNLEEICEHTTSRAYQIKWAYEHIDVGSSCMSLTSLIMSSNSILNRARSHLRESNNSHL